MGKRYDIHIHLAGYGDGSNCQLSPKMRKSVVYKILNRKLGLVEGKDADVGYVKILKDLLDTKELDGGVIFAMDGVIGDDGKLDQHRSHVYVPNDYLFEVCAKNEKFLPGISINPDRPDGVELLQEAIKDGAVVMKWLPSLQHFNPGDPKHDAFYKVMADKGLPLVAHTGCEHTFPDMNQSMGDARLYKRALDLGVKVVMSHCGAACIFHRKHDSVKDVFDMIGAYENLYADTSALCSFLKFYHLNKLDFLKYHERLVHGSDYPIPPFAITYLYPLGFKTTWSLIKNKNPIEKDVLIKKAMGLPQDVFENASRVLGDRVEKWQQCRQDKEKSTLT
jgi:predicted TIM-barrel fold metal-dependent hydrolase